jgi:hypothetical protein
MKKILMCILVTGTITVQCNAAQDSHPVSAKAAARSCGWSWFQNSPTQSSSALRPTAVPAAGPAPALVRTGDTQESKTKTINTIEALLNDIKNAAPEEDRLTARYERTLAFLGREHFIMHRDGTVIVYP